MTAGNNQYSWIDPLRVVATFSVIILHVAAAVVSKYPEGSLYRWWAANIFDSMTRFCVPVFVMLSGALMLGKTYDSFSHYLKKRVSRILIPFLFWSLIYIFKDIFFKFRAEDHLPFVKAFNFTVSQLINGASIHLWYVYMIVGIYLIFPILTGWIKYATNNQILYFLIIWLITITLDMLDLKSIINNFWLIYFSGYIGYAILGYFLFHLDYKIKKHTLLLLIISMVGLTAGVTFLLTLRDGSLNETFYRYLTINVAIISSCIFLIFKDYVRPGEVSRRVFKFCSRYSYGVYLVHMLVLWAINSRGFYGDSINPMFGVPLLSILCFSISLALIYLLHKVKFGKYIAG